MGSDRPSQQILYAPVKNLKTFPTFKDLASFPAAYGAVLPYGKVFWDMGYAFLKANSEGTLNNIEDALRIAALQCIGFVPATGAYLVFYKRTHYFDEFEQPKLKNALIDLGLDAIRMLYQGWQTLETFSYAVLDLQSRAFGKGRIQKPHSFANGDWLVILSDWFDDKSPQGYIKKISGLMANHHHETASKYINEYISKVLYDDEFGARLLRRRRAFWVTARKKNVKCDPPLNSSQVYRHYHAVHMAIERLSLVDREGAMGLLRQSIESGTSDLNLGAAAILQALGDPNAAKTALSNYIHEIMPPKMDKKQLVFGSTKAYTFESEEEPRPHLLRAVADNLDNLHFMETQYQRLQAKIREKDKSDIYGIPIVSEPVIVNGQPYLFLLHRDGELQRDMYDRDPEAREFGFRANGFFTGVMTDAVQPSTGINTLVNEYHQKIAHNKRIGTFHTALPALYKIMERYYEKFPYLVFNGDRNTGQAIMNESNGNYFQTFLDIENKGYTRIENEIAKQLGDGKYFAKFNDPIKEAQELIDIYLEEFFLNTNIRLADYSGAIEAIRMGSLLAMTQRALTYWIHLDNLNAQHIKAKYFLLNADKSLGSIIEDHNQKFTKAEIRSLRDCKLLLCTQVLASPKADHESAPGELKG